MTGWRMARAPGGRRVAMRWIRKPVLASLQPAAPQMNLSAAVAACVASSYGAGYDRSEPSVISTEFDAETVVERLLHVTGG